MWENPYFIRVKQMLVWVKLFQNETELFQNETEVDKICRNFLVKMFTFLVKYSIIIIRGR